MRLVACLQDKFNLHVLRRQQGKRALVVYLFDVGPGLGHGGGDFGQHARNIAGADLDACQTTGAGHAALDDRGQQQRVDIAARQNQPHFLPLELLAVAHQGGQTGCTGPFNQGFFNL